MKTKQTRGLCPIVKNRDVRCGFMQIEDGGWICTCEEPHIVDDNGYCNKFILDEKTEEERIQEKSW